MHAVKHREGVQVHGLPRPVYVLGLVRNRRAKLDSFGLAHCSPRRQAQHSIHRRGMPDCARRLAGAKQCGESARIEPRPMPIVPRAGRRRLRLPEAAPLSQAVGIGGHCLQTYRSPSDCGRGQASMLCSSIHGYVKNARASGRPPRKRGDDRLDCKTIKSAPTMRARP